MMFTLPTNRRFVTAALVLGGLVLLIMNFVLTRLPKPLPQPYIADQVAVLLTGQVNNASFLTNEMRQSTTDGKRLAIAETNSASAVLSAATTAYLGLFADIFSDHRRQAVAVSNFPFAAGPYEFGLALNDNSVLRPRYSAAKRVLEFVAVGPDLLIDDQAVKLNDVVVAVINDIAPDGLIVIGNQVIDVRYNITTSLTVAELLDHGVDYYVLTNANVLLGQNPSFESGLWAPTAADCGAYLAGQPLVRATITTDSSAGRQALLLTAQNHIACMFRNFSVDLDVAKRYQLRFDAKNLAGGEVRYYYAISDETVVKKEQFGSMTTPVNVWQTLRLAVTPLIEGSKLALYFYAPADEHKTSTTIYDDARLEEFVLTRHITMPESVLRRNIRRGNWTLVKNITTILAPAEPTNALSATDPSFESGLSVTADDCSSYLPGRPDIFTTIVSDGTDGKMALELGSRNHFACVSRVIDTDLSRDTYYELAFDYKNITGKTVQYYYAVSNDAGERHDGYGTFDGRADRWQTYRTIIDPTIANAKHFELVLYASADGAQPIINRYDNLTLKVLGKKSLAETFLIADINQLTDAPTFGPFNVSRWRLSAELSPPSAPVLVVVPVVDQRLRLSVNGKIISDQHRAELFGQSTGWVIDQTLVSNNQPLIITISRAAPLWLWLSVIAWLASLSLILCYRYVYR